MDSVVSIFGIIKNVKKFKWEKCSNFNFYISRLNKNIVK